MFSGEFAAGRHFVTVSMGQGAAMQRIRVERKKDAAADYIATVRRLGLDLGASGPITREKAVEAMRFLKARRGLDPLSLCQDILERSAPRGRHGGAGQPVTPPGLGPGAGTEPPRRTPSGRRSCPPGPASPVSLASCRAQQLDAPLTESARRFGTDTRGARRDRAGRS